MQLIPTDTFPSGRKLNPEITEAYISEDGRWFVTRGTRGRIVVREAHTNTTPGDAVTGDWGFTMNKQPDFQTIDEVASWLDAFVGGPMDWRSPNCTYFETRESWADFLAAR